MTARTFRHPGPVPGSTVPLTRRPASFRVGGPRNKSGATIGMWLAAMILATPAAAQTQAAMTAQAGAAYTRADTAMNAQWNRTRAAMRQRGARYATALLASQRAWLTFRDAHCRIAGMEFDGGSLQPMARTQCLAAVTDQRTKQLKDLMWQR